MKNHLILALLVLTTPMAANSASQEGTSTDTDKRIAIARSAGPIFVSKEATIVDVDLSLIHI